MSLLLNRLRGEEVIARVMRSAAFTTFGYAASQAMRLGSNLLLTRLLFPEAFGIMALATAFIVGLSMISDMGTGPAIMQHPRGDDPDFLNTAFTLKVIRGVMLWLASAAIAWPLAQFYNEPLLAQLLPVVGISLFLHGLEPTRVDTAARHMRLGRLTLLDLIGQAIGIAVMVILALIFKSVWALAFSWVCGSATRLFLLTFFLPGHRNRFFWDPSAAQALMRFGIWLFFSSALGFMAAQGDKTILGKYLTMEQLGLYNIGFFLASFPLMLGQTVANRILISIYRERPPKASRDNFLALRKMRFTLTAAVLAVIALFAFSGEWLIALLYDPRYASAGAILVLIAVSQLMSAICMSYDQSALAAGDSRNYFWLSAWRTCCVVGGLLLGAESFGLVGAITGQAIGTLLIYPPLVWLARKHGAWDPLHDAVFGAVATVIAAGALYQAKPAIEALIAQAW